MPLLSLPRAPSNIAAPLVSADKRAALIAIVGAVFISAFLLFLVQPMLAKQILPWFGGGAAVWSICVLFFQTMLVAGYAYANWLAHRSPAAQWTVHALLVVLACACLPVAPDPSLKPLDGHAPALQILMVLVRSVGLPYFLLASTGPLLQSWFARLVDDDALRARVYRLFALSNLASLLALIAYPFVLEPALAVRHQVAAWSCGFVVLAALLVGAAWRMRDVRAAPPLEHRIERGRISVLHYARWIAWSALATSLLVSVTAHLTQNVASMPFLWIVPLALYLASFVVAFERKTAYPRHLVRGLLVPVVPAMAWGLSADAGALHVVIAVLLYSCGLGLACLFCHGELARSKPRAASLTQFYLALSIGGAIGGLAVALIAPSIFNGYWELPIALSLCALAVVVSLRREGPMQMSVAAIAVVVTVMLCVTYADLMLANAKSLTRNFYGTLRVDEIDVQSKDRHSIVRRLLHGVISHGEQHAEAPWNSMPSSYYGPTSGVALALTTSRATARRIGVIGLGTGTVAALTRPGDSVRFYELDPDVVTAARTQFTYLAQAEARNAVVEIVTGDARLALEREIPQRFDVLVVDAFSGDSIPVHLLTAQAFDVYRKHLASGGVIAVHVSNRFLNLNPVVASAAARAGWQAVHLLDDPPVGLPRYAMTRYVLLAEHPERLAHAAFDSTRLNAPPTSQASAWTDDYASLWSVVRLPRRLQ